MWLQMCWTQLQLQFTGRRRYESIYVGSDNIFKYPELADTSRASELISTFEDKQELADMVREEMGDPENTGVQVYIGDEVPVRTMKDCSVVTATYDWEMECVELLESSVPSEWITRM